MILTLAIVCAMGFLASTIDAIAGGGGLISLPALLFVGIPPHLALGTNKLASTAGSLTSSLTFAKSGKVNFNLVKWQIPFTLLGATLGVWSVLRVSSEFLNKAVLLLILVVGLYTVLRKNLGVEDKFSGLSTGKIALGCLFAFMIGFYDGFFGPGTGSFLIFAFITVFGFDFVAASANAKVLNFTSNIVSLALFAFSGKIVYTYGIAMALFMLIGSHVGSKLAISRGAQLVKPIFVTMCFLVGLKLLYNMM